MARRVATWIWVVLGWLLGTTLWTVAFAVGGAAPHDAMPFGAAQMGVASVLALGIWRLSAAVPWRPRSAAFLLTHFAAMIVFATAFTAVQGLIWATRDMTLLGGIASAMTSPVVGWNLLMGDLIYLAIAGISYTRRVTASLQESERARAEARLGARDAQIAALHARLQPHFLFNALHTVSALVNADPDRADRAIDELGQLLRYALREPTDEVTLRQEWEFARDYLAFERLRLGDRLTLDLQVDEDALAERVPPFVLQPLIENAIRHGAGAMPAGGTLGVRIAREQGAIRIEIRNSVAPVGERSGMAGSGLRLLAERLELSYGGAAKLDVVRAGDFSVTLRLPGAGPAE